MAKKENKFEKWKVLNSEEVYSSQFVTLYKEKLEKPDGTVVKDFFSVKRRDAVFVIALSSDEKVPLVYQYKNGIKEVIYELPAGFIEDNEEPLQAGIRELMEETGYAGKEQIPLGSFVPNPSISSNRNFVFLFKNAEKVAEQRLDGNEVIDVRLFKLQDLVDSIKVRQSIFVDTQSQLAILLAWEEINKWSL